MIKRLPVPRKPEASELLDVGSLRNCFSVRPRIGSRKIYVALAVTHYGFPLSHGRGEGVEELDNVSPLRELISNRGRNGLLHLHITAVECRFGKARLLERRLHIHSE